jgi:hypothetical protein
MIRLVHDSRFPLLGSPRLVAAFKRLLVLVSRAVSAWNRLGICWIVGTPQPGCGLNFHIRLM